jgi:hypothetical protein
VNGIRIGKDTAGYPMLAACGRHVVADGELLLSFLHCHRVVGGFGRIYNGIVNGVRGDTNFLDAFEAVAKHQKHKGGRRKG